MTETPSERGWAFWLWTFVAIFEVVLAVLAAMDEKWRLAIHALVFAWMCWYVSILISERDAARRDVAELRDSLRLKLRADR